MDSTAPAAPVDVTWPLKLVGWVAWVVAGSPVIVSLASDPTGLQRPNVIAWFVCYALFAIAYAAFPKSEFSAARRLPLTLLAVQSACAIACNALIPIASGGIALGGVLLVIVAAQLIPPLSQRSAMCWLVAQSVGLYLAFAATWPSRIALIATLGYAAFQLMALTFAAFAQRERRSRLALALANAELHSTRGLLAEAARAAERDRIWRELHDVVGHHLAGVSLSLEAAAATTTGRPQELVRRAQTVTRLLLGNIRDVMDEHALPPDDLAREIENLATSCPGLDVRTTISSPLPALSPMQTHALVRCAQECLTNIVRHAVARTAWIELSPSSGGIRLQVRDDGRGAASVTPGTGLNSMRRRIEEAGGRLEITTSSGAGFTVTATIPVGGEAAR